MKGPYRITEIGRMDQQFAHEHLVVDVLEGIVPFGDTFLRLIHQIEMQTHVCK